MIFKEMQKEAEGNKERRGCNLEPEGFLEFI